MRLILLVVSFILVLSCSINYEFDEIEMIDYRWAFTSLYSAETKPNCRIYATIDGNGRCQLMNYYSFSDPNGKIPIYGQFNINKEKLGDILSRFRSINKDSNLLREMMISGPEPNLNYLIHEKSQSKTIFIRTDNYNSIDYCFIDFYNYLFSICKSHHYIPLEDTIEIYYKCKNIIDGLTNGSILNLPPPPPIELK